MLGGDILSAKTICLIVSELKINSLVLEMAGLAYMHAHSSNEN